MDFKRVDHILALSFIIYVTLPLLGYLRKQPLIISIPTIPLIAYLSFRLHHLWKYYGKRFNAYSTADETAEDMDLINAVAIVTGCNSGIGKETVRVLLKHNATVIMACRNKEKAEKAKIDIIQALDSDNKAQYESKFSPLD